MDSGKGMEIAFVCNSGLDIYYKYLNEGELPLSRHLASETALREYELRMTRSYLTEQFGLMRADANSGELVTLFSRIDEIQKRMDDAAPDEILLKISAAYFFERNEPQFYDATRAKKKIEKWKKDPQALDFFLLQAWKRIADLEVTSDMLTQTYSQETLKETPQKMDLRNRPYHSRKSR